MAKLICFAILCLIAANANSEESDGSEGSESLSSQPLTRTRRQDEVDIITRGRDGRIVNEIDIITGRRSADDIRTGRRRTEAVRRVVERRPPASRTVEEIDILTGRRRSGRREIDILGERSGVREIDIVRRRGSSLRDIDILDGRRSGSREVIERRRTTTSTTRDRDDRRIPAARAGVEEGSAGLDTASLQPMPYKFQYMAPNHKSVVERQEEGDADGTVRGFYTIDMGNGLYRYVDYIADRHGYRAAIRSNEPGLGVGAQGPPSDTTFELEQPPADLRDIDLSDRTDTETSRTTSRTTTRTTEARDIRRPTVIEERRRTRTESRRGVSGVRLVPISDAERDRRERVIIEEEIIEEPRRTVIVEEERPETVIIEEVREEPRRVVIEERRTERREGPRVITRA